MECGKDGKAISTREYITKEASSAVKQSYYKALAREREKTTKFLSIYEDAWVWEHDPTKVHED